MPHQLPAAPEKTRTSLRPRAMASSPPTAREPPSAASSKPALKDEVLSAVGFTFKGALSRLPFFGGLTVALCEGAAERPSRKRGSPRPPAASSCAKNSNDALIKAKVELEQGRNTVGFVARVFNADSLRDQLARSEKTNQARTSSSGSRTCSSSTAAVIILRSVEQLKVFHANKGALDFARATLAATTSSASPS
jgi:hypothetical protein